LSTKQFEQEGQFGRSGELGQDLSQAPWGERSRSVVDVCIVKVSAILD
jgi:hypothetical protein